MLYSSIGYKSFHYKGVDSGKGEGGCWRGVSAQLLLYTMRCYVQYYKFAVDWRIYRSMANTHRGLVYCTIKNNLCDF